MEYVNGWDEMRERRFSEKRGMSVQIKITLKIWEHNAVEIVPLIQSHVFFEIFPITFLPVLYRKELPF